MSGYYRMHRGWQDHPVFGSDAFSRRDAWEWLISHAAWKETRVGVGSKTVTLKRGQLSYSIRFLASTWRWDEKRVRRCLDKFQNADMIAAATAAGQTVITICNYEQYQTKEERAAAGNGHEPPHQRRTSAANKKEGEEVNNSSGSVSNETSPARDMRSIVFDEGLSWLAAHTSKRPDQLRPLLGKWVRDHGDGEVISAIAECQRSPPVDPIAWLQKRFSGSKFHDTSFLENDHC